MKSNHSYNAGYHRGLNTEYHDVPIETLFKKWVEETDIRLVPVVFDPVAFERGYNDGKDDYLCGGNTPERVEEQIEWLEKIVKQKEIESAAAKAAHKVMEQHSEAFEKLAESKK